ncbi:glycosyltransferase [Cohnella sp. GbtcB17]|uniref:glycosyltransferase n=1 Tax=Cohnella sp. GbtcB17 TaxID=2824762 RepID=UPI001C2FFEAD|nr:glycosyltransferase [Cohnella sp. GbtcB17]
MKISVCLIVRNEEENLARALNSVPASYEIIVADTGSTDRTMEIARTLGAKVVSIPWSDDFASARNASAAAATGDYILALDADEQLPADTEEQIRIFVAAYPKSAGCVQIINVMGEEVSKHRMVRFYPNDGSFAFQGFVHEHVYYDGAPASFEDLPLIIAHYGYEAGEYEKKDKASRYIPLYEKHLAAHPDDGYMLYQTGKLYYGIKDWGKAEHYLRASVQCGQVDRLYYPVMLVMLGYLLKEQGRSGEAAALLKPVQQSYPSFPDLFFLLGLLAMDTGDFQGIPAYFSKALEIGETVQYTSVDGVGSYKAAYNLGVFYEVTGQRDLANRYYRYAGDLGYAPALARLN